VKIVAAWVIPLLGFELPQNPMVEKVENVAAQGKSAIKVFKNDTQKTRNLTFHVVS